MAFVPMCNKVQTLKEHPRSTPPPPTPPHPPTQKKKKKKKIIPERNQNSKKLFKEAIERKNEKGVRSLSNRQILFSDQDLR